MLHLVVYIGAMLAAVNPIVGIHFFKLFSCVYERCFSSFCFVRDRYSHSCFLVALLFAYRLCTYNMLHWLALVRWMLSVLYWVCCERVVPFVV